MKRWTNTFYENGSQKRAGVAILIPDKIDIKSEIAMKLISSLYNDKSVNLTIRGDIRTPKYIKQTLATMEGEIAIK